MSLYKDVYDEVDVILPVLEYDSAQVSAEIRSIHGILLQQRSRFERSTAHDIERMAMIDARFGGIDERLDKMQEHMDAMQGQLARLLEILDGGR